MPDLEVSEHSPSWHTHSPRHVHGMLRKAGDFTRKQLISTPLQSHQILQQDNCSGGVPVYACTHTHRTERYDSYLHFGPYLALAASENGSSTSDALQRLKPSSLCFWRPLRLCGFSTWPTPEVGKVDLAAEPCKGQHRPNFDLAQAACVWGEASSAMTLDSSNTRYTQSRFVCFFIWFLSTEECTWSS